MKIVTEVFPIEAYMSPCPICGYIQITQNLEFRYLIEKQITGLITSCHKCGNKLLIIKPNR